MGLNLRTMQFPSDYAEDEEVQLRRCTSLGKATSMILDDPTQVSVTDFFRCFYGGFAAESAIWFVYHNDDNDYENPIKFRFDDWRGSEYSMESLRAAITPGILPANFASGRGHHTFEFYYHSVAARQQGFGQVPPPPNFITPIASEQEMPSTVAWNITGY